MRSARCGSADGSSHDLDALVSAEAQQLVTASDDRLCLRDNRTGQHRIIIYVLYSSASHPAASSSASNSRAVAHRSRARPRASAAWAASGGSAVLAASKRWPKNVVNAWLLAMSGCCLASAYSSSPRS